MINNHSAITIYSTSWCGPCASAKRLLKEKGFAFEEVDIEEKGMTREDLYEKTGGRTIPQIIINDINIGGYDDLLLLDKDGSLKT